MGLHNILRMVHKNIAGGKIKFQYSRWGNETPFPVYINTFTTFIDKEDLWGHHLTRYQKFDLELGFFIRHKQPFTVFSNDYFNIHHYKVEDFPSFWDLVKHKHLVPIVKTWTGKIYWYQSILCVWPLWTTILVNI